MWVVVCGEEATLCVLDLGEVIFDEVFALELSGWLNGARACGGGGSSGGEVV